MSKSLSPHAKNPIGSFEIVPLMGSVVTVAISYLLLFEELTISPRYNEHEQCLLTINVPLFKKLRDIIFFGGGESLYDPFRGTF